MSVSSQATFNFKAKEQLDALETFQYKLQGRSYEGKSFKDVANIDNSNLTCAFSGCFSYLDFQEECLTQLCLHIASCVPSCSFSCDDACFENEVDGSYIRYEFDYHGDKGVLDVTYTFYDPNMHDQNMFDEEDDEDDEGFDDFDDFEDFLDNETVEYYTYTFKDGEWKKEET